MPWMEAMKTSLAYSRKAAPGHVLLALVYGFLLSCCIPLTAPLAAVTIWIAYEDHSAGLTEAAAEGESSASS